ncbi:hypothetical protein Pcinc_024924 [Petrolisthes cinctipes]|uniref:Uncharacterized protein n=1 Tax=Petrolisthes cinctipes TaxID=88211 RepID=A0AAE1FAA9_PETCI|nr:hypothetical protein Pcinc_024924 [Petrolisthes cinctipes]
MNLKSGNLGADPNLYHKEKGCCPLHIAAWGRPGITSGVTHSIQSTSWHYSLSNESNHRELAEHLTHCQYEVTDHLTFYLSGCKPEP